MVPVKLLILGAQNTGKTGELHTEIQVRDGMEMCEHIFRII